MNQSESPSHVMNGSLVSRNWRIYSLCEVFIGIAVVLTPIFSWLIREYGGQMYPYFIIIYLWNSLFLIFMASLLIELRQDSSIVSRISRTPTSLFILLIIGGVSRLLFLGSEPLLNIDVLYYLDYGKFILNGFQPYIDFYFPYPPVFAYFIYTIMNISPTIDSFRILMVVFDIAIILLLWIATKSSKLSFLIPAAYAFLPFAIIESGLNGHFEPIANLFFILALICSFKTKYRLSGLFIGLSIATKIYAILFTPLLLITIPEVRKKLEYIITIILTVVLTYVPFWLIFWSRENSDISGDVVSGSNIFLSISEYFYNLGTLHIFSSILIISLIVLLFVILSIWVLKPNFLRTVFLYDLISDGVGILLVILALIAGLFPITNLALNFYWRYPADIALVRGMLTAFIGILIIRTSWKRWRAIPNRIISPIQLLLLVGVLFMLLLSVSTDVFAAWYLLWALPPLLFLKDKRLMIVILACLVFLSPSYIHNDFNALGYDERKIWSEDFSSTDGWLISVDSDIEVPNVTADLQIIDNLATFFVDASMITNKTLLHEVKVIWSRNTSIEITQNTEFVVIASASWDPTFGKHANVSLQFEGENTDGILISGIILPEDCSLTNLTTHHCRFAFHQGIIVEITKLTLVLQPLKAARMDVFIETMYTTEIQHFRLSSIPIVLVILFPNLLAICLLIIVLPNELESIDDISN